MATLFEPIRPVPPMATIFMANLLVGDLPTAFCRGYRIDVVTTVLPRNSPSTASLVTRPRSIIHAASDMTDAATDSDDASVVRALRRGDEGAFARLVDQHHASLRRVARLYLSNRAVADEVVQDTWLGVIQGIWAFEGRSSSRPHPAVPGEAVRGRVGPRVAATSAQDRVPHGALRLPRRVDDSRRIREDHRGSARHRVGRPLRKTGGPRPPVAGKREPGLLH